MQMGWEGGRGEGTEDGPRKWTVAEKQGWGGKDLSSVPFLST